MSTIKVPNYYMARGGESPTEEHLRNIVPAIFAESPSDNVSSRYGFVSTKRIVDVLENDGYHVAQARGGIRLTSRSHGIHEVRLRKFDHEVKVNDIFPEIVLINSHNGTSSAILHMGLFRKICANGLVVGEAFQTSFRVPHIGEPRENILTAATHIMKSAPRLNDTIDRWRKRIMTVAEVNEFGRRAAELRKFSGPIITDPDRVGSITSAHRKEDASQNLWHVFNRTQENLVRGGVLVASETTGKVRHSRGLRAVKPLVELNRGLWDLAEEFLPA
jgi:hypothetical protein